jgi:hypothetical protein
MCSLVVALVAVSGCESYSAAQEFLLTSNRYTLLLKLKDIGYLEDGLHQDAWYELSWQ